MCILPLQRVRFVYLDWWDPTKLCTFHTPINLLVTTLFSFTPDTEWSKRQGEIKMTCGSAPWSASWPVGLLAQWRDVSVARKSNPVNQRQLEASKRVPEHCFAGRWLRCFETLVKCVWLSNRCSRYPYKASSSFVKTSRSRIKKRLHGRIFFSRVKFLCWLLFDVRSTPCNLSGT